MFSVRLQLINERLSCEHERQVRAHRQRSASATGNVLAQRDKRSNDGKLTRCFSFLFLCIDVEQNIESSCDW